MTKIKLILIADAGNLGNAWTAAMQQMIDAERGLHWTSATMVVNDKKFFVEKNKTGTIVARQSDEPNE